MSRLWGNVYWPAYLILASLPFIVPEVVALFTNPANTLSDYCWRMLNVNVAYGHGIHTFAWWTSLAAWLIFTILITIHIWWRGI